MKDRLGLGGYGAVFKAVEKSTEKVFAIKHSKIDDEVTERQCSAEGEIMKKMHHRYIVKCVEWFKAENAIWVVMELYHGDLYNLVYKQY